MNLKLIKILFFFGIIFSSCSTNNQLTYLKDADHLADLKKEWSFYKPSYIQIDDIFKIEITTPIDPEAALIYNQFSSTTQQGNDLNVLNLQGYLVNSQYELTLPVLGKINVKNKTIDDLQNDIKDKLVNGGYLSKPRVNIRQINSKFTVLGEVHSPGTFNYLENDITLFQALGYAGDLTINGKRRNIILVRQDGNSKKIFEINLTDTNVFDSEAYHIKNNDILIINPNYSRVKSAGFIGDASSIASISSLIVSITLLILTNN